MSAGASLAELRAVLDEVADAAACSHPIRLAGRTVRGDSGEIERGLLVVACNDRRATRCPACARRYRADAWHLVAAGIVGGKGVPASVTEHPMLFATLTAPSFGRVHSRPRDPASAAPCAPGRDQRCRHGRPRACALRHRPGDPMLGAPLCPYCYDVTGAVLFNAHVPLLWNRTTVALVRELARAADMSERRLRSVARLSYVKVAEFQRRGSVHLHHVVRLDGADGPGSPPPANLDANVLETSLRAAVGRVRVTVPGSADGRRVARSIGWGRELEIHALTGDGLTPAAVAAYVAKYTTKDVDELGRLGHPIRSLGQLDALGLPSHLDTLARRAFELGGDPALSHLHLRERAHRLGYPGHVQSKSRVYSTTLGSLRDARRAFVRAHRELPETFDGGWTFVGRGYLHRDAAREAETLQALDIHSTRA